MSVTISGLDIIIAHLGVAAHELATSLVAHVGSELPYADFVEHGTRRMGPFPYLQPATDDNMPAIAAAVEVGLLELVEQGDPGPLHAGFRAAVALVETEAKAIVHVRSGDLRASIHTTVDQ
jgi:hypothetical protein